MGRVNPTAAAHDAHNKILDEDLPASILARPTESRYRLGEAASTNAALIKNSKAKVFAYEFSNLNATTWRFVKLYNKATTPAPATDTGATVLMLKIAIPPNSSRAVRFERGLDFANGLGIAVTGLVADNDATVIAANEVVGYVLYY